MTPPTRLSWKDVRDEIHKAILSGRYGPGDRLPRDADIAEEMNCARSTVQRAMQDLSDSGLVDRRRKGGTRVRAEPVTRATLDIPITRREVEQRGGRYGYQLIRRVEETAPHSVLATFELTTPQPMQRIEALHFSDGRPYILEDRWVCPETVPEIRDLDLTSQSANEWLVLNKPYSRCDMRFFAITAEPQMAELLETEVGAALLVIERTTWIETAPITTVKAITAPGYRLLTTS
ncbi:MAG: GntR family transcriptional regulator [Marinovum algicola]|jgi:GntR family histidine utilization transcriptional repressor|uniref:Transcriptional regulator, GntR family n=1 Tax=Marinovum algicola TaxID=42444 RepID=A0A975WBB5_9RHOB|nr:MULTISPECIES: GntR family transcriptional regulator [Marinovum]AKO99493.1 Transcriptional regulator [Marinovum algicola DG 898]MDD9743878.1 GntR family transcriptional regulator [Marinovum sp. PR37]SEJ72976.1 transcriptional regulator, GntR family [Marinovum algicola]SLN57274.1 HTH-type transcriptional repressor YvoA [Marinovum algicola]